MRQQNYKNIDWGAGVLSTVTWSPKNNDNNMQQIAGRLHDFDYERERMEAGWVSAREATLIF